MFPLMGIETEYGISVDEKGPEYLAGETAALLRALPFAHFTRWDEGAENPLQDLRGFRARGLVTDPKDKAFDQQGQPAASSPPVRVERLLTNGARLYNDHGHPEYSTPECASIADLVAHDRAGEAILLACVKALQEQIGINSIKLYKNNTDFHGFSYGCHENYLLPRLRKPEKLLEAFIPFLVSRQIFTGAGKVGVEVDTEQTEITGRPLFQLSQRADFFSQLMGVDTLYQRPLINTRDEPHADPARYMRLHVIAGDANRSQYALALKMGTTSLVLRVLADGWRPPVELEDPVQATKAISRDQERKWLVPLKDGRVMSAIDIQSLYIEAIAAQFPELDAEARWIISEWRKTLEMLAADPLQLADRLDWPAKLLLIDTFIAAEGTDDPAVLQSLDLEYHNLDPQVSLFAALEMQQIVSEAAIKRAMDTAPADTRAMIRGEAIRRFCDELSALSWGRLRLQDGDLDLGRLVDGSLALLNQELVKITSLREFTATVRRWEHEHDYK